LTLSLLEVEDEDNPPQDLSLVIQNGTGYTVSTGNKIVIAQTATNSIKVNVAVSDGTDESDVFQMHVLIGTVVTGLDKIPLEIIETQYYPNPSNNVVHFRLPVTEPLTFEFYDLAGNLLKTQLIEAYTGVFDFDVSLLPVGMYSFKLYNSKYLSTGKITISR